MRLIDADKLNFSEQHYNKSQMKAILDFIDNQPTAYDVDDTVAKLEEIKNGHEKNICVYCAMDKAIEIVKAGDSCGPDIK